MSQSRLLIVHPDPAALGLLSSMVRSLGHVIDEAANDRLAVKLMERGGVDVVLAGVDPADPDALELLNHVRRKYRQVPVILLFPTPHPGRAKEALRLGALSVLRDPMPATELRAVVTQALAAGPKAAGTLGAASAPAPIATPSRTAPTAPGPDGYLAHHASSSPAAPPAPATGNANGSSPPRHPHAGPRGESFGRGLGVIGNDPSLAVALELAATVAASKTPVLIVGERGTGKALLARTIHTLGARPDQPFVAVDCAALTAATLERDRLDGLFHDRDGDDGDDDETDDDDDGRRSAAGNGQARRLDGPTHRPGDSSATATASEPGFDWLSKLGQAQGGTFFLKDVAALSDALQVQLLRAFQDREAERGPGPGGSRSDVRVLMSTCENLEALVELGRFRQDLYHRAGVFCLKLPPLRHRAGDVELLAESFRARFSKEFGKNVVGFSRDALEALARHDWPGNVRELEGVIQRGVALCQASRVSSGHLAPSLGASRGPRALGYGNRQSAPSAIRPLKEALEEPEKRIIIQALQALNWNRQETARVLDINRTTLYKKMKKYGLLVDEPAWVN